MLKYLFTQSLRELKAQIRNYLFTYIGLLAISSILLKTTIDGIYASGFSLSDNLILVGAVVCAVQLFSILFQKTLVFAMHPAAMHYFFNSDKLNRVKVLLLIKKAVSKLIFSFLICLVLYNFRISAPGLWLVTFNLSVYFLLGSFIRWFKYNKLNFFALAVFFVCSGLLFMLAFSQIIVLASIPLFAFCIFLICYNRKLKVNWGKYYDDALYAAKIGHAGRHRDMALMQQFTAEHIAEKEHSIKIYSLPLNKNNALLCKALIEAMRMSKQVIVILSLLLAAAVLLNKTTFFAGVPIIGEPQIAYVVGMFAIGAFLSNLRNIYAKQILTVYEKHRMGFFIPYSFTKIVYSYGSVCCLITTFVSLILCGVFMPGWIKGAAIIAIFNLVMILSFFMVTKNKTNNVISVISNFVFILGAGLFF